MLSIDPVDIPFLGPTAPSSLTINFGTIDSDYRGEVFILVVNLSKSNFIIERGMRVAQIVFNKFERVNLKSKLELDPTLRGASGFGSTGLKE